MKITELIAQLEQLKAVHGDIKVTYHDDFGVGSCDIDRIVPIYPYKWGVEDKTQPAFEIELI